MNNIKATKWHVHPVKTQISLKNMHRLILVVTGHVCKLYNLLCADPKGILELEVVPFYPPNKSFFFFFFFFQNIWYPKKMET